MSGGMVLVDVSGKAEVVLTTKGDIATFDTARVRKGVSATNYTGIQADSAIADGLTYGATARSTLTGTGSLLYSSGANTLSQLSAGTGEYTLKMNSGATAPEWVNVTSGASVPTTTKGDISGFTTTQARIPISSNNYSLLADSGEALGLKWAASATSVLATTGDILCASASNVLSGVGAGASGTVMTGNGVGVMPSFQASTAAPSLDLQTETMGSTFTTSATDQTTVTGMVITLTQTTGKFLATWIGSVYANADGHLAATRLILDDVEMQHEVWYGTAPANVYKPIVVQFWGVSSDVDVEFQIRISNPSYTVSVIGPQGSLNTLEIY